MLCDEILILSVAMAAFQLEPPQLPSQQIVCIGLEFSTTMDSDEEAALETNQSDKKKPPEAGISIDSSIIQTTSKNVCKSFDLRYFFVLNSFSCGF